MKRMGMLASAGACLIVPATAHATDVFQLEGFGPTSRAMGGTAVAHDTGPAGMLVNPAVLSLGPEGSQAVVGLDMVTTDIDVTNTGTGETASSRTHGANRGPYFAPEIGYTWRGGKLALGVGVFALGGLGTEYGNASFLSRATGNVATGLGNSSRLLKIAVPVAISYNVTNKLTVGVSVQGQWQSLNLDLLLGADQVGSLIGAGRVDGTLLPVLGGLPDLRGAHFSLTRNQFVGGGVRSVGVSERIGLVYRAAPGTTLGLSFAPKSQMADMKGRATLTAIDGVAGQVPVPGKIRIVDFQSPAQINAGISHRLTPNLLLALDISEVFWKDAMRDLNVAFTDDGGATLNIRLPQNYRNQTIVALGAAYDVNDRWTLRGGLRVANQALRSQTIFAVVPATPTTHLTAGFGYKLGSGSLNFAFSHAFAPKMKNASLPNTSAPISIAHAQNNAAIDYRISF